MIVYYLKWICGQKKNIITNHYYLLFEFDILGLFELDLYTTTTTTTTANDDDCDHIILMFFFLLFRYSNHKQNKTK